MLCQPAQSGRVWPPANLTRGGREAGCTDIGQAVIAEADERLLQRSMPVVTSRKHGQACRLPHWGCCISPVLSLRLSRVTSQRPGMLRRRLLAVQLCLPHLIVGSVRSPLT